MKLMKILTDITRISEDDELNLLNYMQSLKYIDNLYRFVNIFSDIDKLESPVFLPTFKATIVAEKIGEAVSDEESELRLIQMQSPSFVEDTTYSEIYDMMTDKICYNVSRDEMTMTFYLKNFNNSL